MIIRMYVVTYRKGTKSQPVVIRAHDEVEAQYQAQIYVNANLPAGHRLVSTQKFKITAKEQQILDLIAGEMYLSEIVAGISAQRGSASAGAVSCALKNLVLKNLLECQTKVDPRYRSGRRVYYRLTTIGQQQRKVA